MRQAAGATVSQPPPLGVAVGQMSHRVADVAPVMVLQLLLRCCCLRTRERRCCRRGLERISLLTWD
jgi:hypothetical protein